jgi:predicted heme/steroid binding protein/uncharacterized membrane protein
LNKIITQQELQANDGQEGRPAYIVYKGKVYDVSQSRLWRTGTHVRRHQAGNDLTGELPSAPHDESVFDKVILVGELAAAAPPSVEEPDKGSPLLDFYFAQHPHPVAVHFPVALSVVTAAFALLHLLTNEQVFESTAYYVLWAAVIMTPLTIISGAFSWWLNYGHKFTDNFKDKIVFSAIYTVLGAIALALRTANHEVLLERESLGWVYIMLLMAQVVSVSILGRVGTNILFPPKNEI